MREDGIQVTRFYCVYFGMDLYVDFNYFRWTDELDSEIELLGVYYDITYSMGVGHRNDYTKLFFSCPEFKEQFSEFVIKKWEKENE
jgi:hypothetical protein